jgi:archaellum component FlaC
MVERLERIETRLDGVAVRLDRVEARLDGVEVRLDRVETKVDGLSTEVKELGTRVGRVKVQLEDLKDTVNKFTNTMGARFDALDRRLEERDKQFAAKFLDIKLVLTNHNKRITVLERRPRRRT